MSPLLSILKTLLIPGLISLALYVLLTYLFLPFLRRYRQRYTQYLPLSSISTSLTPSPSLRSRLSTGMLAFLLPPFWRRHHRIVDGSAADVARASASSDGWLDEEEGESMVGFEIDARRREALERRRSSVGDDQRRVSRELEEGFKDDSSDEEDESANGSRVEIVAGRR